MAADKLKKRSDAIDAAKVLIVGAGGIGCELLKTVALSGFNLVHIIDKDTVEVSNLNKHLLFRNSHVGQSKAEVAASAVNRFRPLVSISPYHANVKDSQFNMDFFEMFDIVLSGLGNLDARQYVNRLCLAANVPLVETGTIGFLRQVTVHVNGKTECIECRPKPGPETYTACTITNTPSKFVHCIVWAKELLFGKLFGDRNQEIDLNIRSSETGSSSEPNDDDAFVRRKDEPLDEYGRRIYDHVFGDNIETALSNEETWKNRNRPKPIYSREQLNGNAGENCTAENVSSLSATTSLGLKNPQEIWSLVENTRIFFQALRLLLMQRQKEIGYLSFDIDDHLAVEFVTAAANIRAASFGIPLHSLFEAKGIASNIVHDSAATNAVIAGLIVIEAVKVLQEQDDKYKTTYCLERPTTKNMLLVPIKPYLPNKACYVCSEAPLSLEINTHRSTLRDLVDNIVKAKLGMDFPMVVHKSALLYEVGSDLEEDEVAEYASNLEKVLSQLPSPVTGGEVLKIGDVQQELLCTINIVHREEFDEEREPDEMLLIQGTHAPLVVEDDKPPTESTRIRDTSTMLSSPMHSDTEDDEIEMFTTDPSTIHTRKKTKLSPDKTSKGKEPGDDSDVCMLDSSGPDSGA